MLEQLAWTAKWTTAGVSAGGKAITRWRFHVESSTQTKKQNTIFTDESSDKWNNNELGKIASLFYDWCETNEINTLNN